MTVQTILRQQPGLFFRLSGIRLSRFDALVSTLYPLWLEEERQRLSRKGRKRAIGGGMKDRLAFAEQLLLCLIYYRPYSSQGFMGLVFSVSSPTVCRRVQAMTALMADPFRMPERRVRLSQVEKDDLLYLMIDGTERPVHRPCTASRRKRRYSGKKKGHTVSYALVTDHRKRILAVGPACDGRRHDKRIDDESRLDRPPDVLTLGDLGYRGTSLEIPLKASKTNPLGKQDKACNRWHAQVRIGVEHAIGRMKKFRIFSDIHRNNRQQDMIAKNVGALANLNLNLQIA